MIDRIKHFGQQISPSKNQVPNFILNKGCDRLKFDMSAIQKKKKDKNKLKKKKKKYI